MYTLSYSSSLLPGISLRGTNVPGNIRSLERKFPGTLVPGAKSSRELSFQGANVPSGNFRSEERKYRGAKSPWTTLMTLLTVTLTRTLTHVTKLLRWQANFYSSNCREDNGRFSCLIHELRNELCNAMQHSRDNNYPISRINTNTKQLVNISGTYKYTAFLATLLLCTQNAQNSLRCVWLRFQPVTRVASRLFTAYDACFPASL